MIKYAPERKRVLDELVVAYDELAGERLDGLISQEIYIKRKLQLNFIAFDAGIGSPEIEREIAKRYRR
jgi:superfamily II helicase